MQTQPGSPSRASSTVMLIALDMRVAQLPMNVRRAMTRRLAFVLCLYEYSPERLARTAEMADILLRGSRNSDVR
jgi:hypothetical protein